MPQDKTQLDEIVETINDQVTLLRSKIIVLEKSVEESKNREDALRVKFQELAQSQSNKALKAKVEELEAENKRLRATFKSKSKAKAYKGCKHSEQCLAGDPDQNGDREIWPCVCGMKHYP